jgi:hypothetical protein
MRGIRLLAALMRADAYGSGAFGPEVARAARLLAACGRVALWSVGLGGLGSLVGLFGQRWLASGVNEGPLRWTLIAGLLGFLGGLTWGLWRERERQSSE